MAAHENEPEKPANPSPRQDTGRREFIKRVGAFVFSLTLLSQAKPLLASCDGECDGTPPDTSCDSPGESDGSCGWWDGDGGCGAGERDNNCGDSTSRDTDQNCEPPCSDTYDPDGDCNMLGDSNDASCGDCDDNHDTDNNCARPAPGDDADNLCGHPHNIGLDEDDNCTTTHGPDSYCGTYSFDYQWFGPITDTDQACCKTDGDIDNQDDDRTGGCGNDHNKPEWHYSAH
jgi:hypothetical protein